MNEKKYIKYYDNRNKKYKEAVQWTGKNQAEIHEFLKYLYCKYNLSYDGLESNYANFDKTLKIKVNGGKYNTHVNLNFYIVESEAFSKFNTPFTVCGPTLFKQYFDEANGFKVSRVKYKDYSTLYKNNECKNNTTKESSEKKHMIHLNVTDTTLHVSIENVIFNDPATIVVWGDGSKTVVKCQDGDDFDKEKGLAMAISKKVLGNKSNFNNTFKHFIGEDEEPFYSGVTADFMKNVLNNVFGAPKKPTYYSKVGEKNRTFIDMLSYMYGYDRETLSKLLIKNNFNRALMLKALSESVK